MQKDSSLKFTEFPSKIMRIHYGSYMPGLGHQIITMCYGLKYCLMNNIYPVIEDSHNNAFGKWTDYFESFWDESQTKDLSIQDNLEIMENKLNWSENRIGFFGENWKDIVDDIKALFLEIFLFKDIVRKQIQKKIDHLNLPCNYSSVHIRRGDKNIQVADYGKKTDSCIIQTLKKALTRRGVENVFLMTDDIAILYAMQKIKSFNIYTLCPATFNGDTYKVRTSEGHMLKLLTEISIAERSENHFQTVNSNVTRIVRLLRKDANCHHIFDSSYDINFV